MHVGDYLLVATSNGWHEVIHSVAIELVEQGKGQLVEPNIPVKHASKFRKLDENDRKKLSEGSPHNRKRHQTYLHRMMEADVAASPEALITSGMMSPNEVRQMEGLPAIETKVAAVKTKAKAKE